MAIAISQETEVLTVSRAVDQFIFYCTEIECLSKWTIKTRMAHLKQFRAYCAMRRVEDVTFITLPFVDAYFIDYTKTRSQNTANTGRRIVKVFLAWLRDYKELQLRIEPRLIRLVRLHDTTPRYIDRKIIENVIRGTRNKQDRLLIAVAFEAGLRITELMNIRTSDISGCGIHVKGKGAIDRTVYITDTLARNITNFIEEKLITDGDYLFQNDYISARKGKMSDSTIRNRIKRHFIEIAGLNMYPHQLRHSLAIELLSQGCDIVTIQHILGHTDIKVTMAYLRVSNTFLENQHHKFLCKSVL